VSLSRSRKTAFAPSLLEDPTAAFSFNPAGNFRFHAIGNASARGIFFFPLYALGSGISTEAFRSLHYIRDASGTIKPFFLFFFQRFGSVAAQIGFQLRRVGI